MIQAFRYRFECQSSMASRYFSLVGKVSRTSSLNSHFSVSNRHVPELRKRSVCKKKSWPVSTTDQFETRAAREKEFQRLQARDRQLRIGASCPQASSLSTHRGLYPSVPSRPQTPAAPVNTASVPSPAPSPLAQSFTTAEHHTGQKRPRTRSENHGSSATITPKSSDTFSGDVSLAEFLQEPPEPKRRKSKKMETNGF